VVVGFADVLARDGSDLVVIDYKTDAVDEGPALAERASAYAPQGATYSGAIQEALGLPTPPRCELWFLRAGRIVMV
jgi:ATP-dependent exoDNAse (exonuclease V) beta subunit